MEKVETIDLGLRRRSARSLRAIRLQRPPGRRGSAAVLPRLALWERLQSQLAKVTALLLVPTLIAGVFGANTQLPGIGSWLGFDLMIVLMICSAVAVYLTMRNDFHDSKRRRTGRRHDDTSSG